MNSHIPYACLLSGLICFIVIKMVGGQNPPPLPPRVARVKIMLTIVLKMSVINALCVGGGGGFMNMTNILANKH